MVRNVVKSVDHQVKECVKRISDEDLRWLSIKFRERLGGDLAESLLFIQDHFSELNRILCNTTGADSVYDVADIIDRSIQEEAKKDPYSKKETLISRR